MVADLGKVLIQQADQLAAVTARVEERLRCLTQSRPMACAR